MAPRIFADFPHWVWTDMDVTWEDCSEGLEILASLVLDCPPSLTSGMGHQVVLSVSERQRDRAS